MLDGGGSGIGSGCFIVILLDALTFSSLPVEKSPTVPEADIVTLPELPAVQLKLDEPFSSQSLNPPAPLETEALTGPAPLFKVIVTVKVSPGDTVDGALIPKLAAFEMVVIIKLIITNIPIPIIIFNVFLFISICFPP